MTGRRCLDALLTELGDSAQALAALPGVRPSSVSIALPIDLRLGFEGGRPSIIGDVPLFRTRTAFDTEPAMLHVNWHSIPVTPEGVV